MSKEEKIKEAITDILWMAIRYADGRHTYVPSTVRRAVKTIKEVYGKISNGEKILPN